MVVIVSRRVYHGLICGAVLLALLLLWRSPAIRKVISKPGRVMVMIDPGHGGVDGGCQGGSMQEKNVNLRIALALKDWLKQAGIPAGLTRDGDYPLEPFGRPGRHRRDLTKRVRLIKDSGAVVFISIHCDWSSDSSRYGPAVFYHPNNEASRCLAQAVQHQLNQLAGITRREAPGDYFILRTARVPGILVEAGFLSNPAERLRLQDQRYFAAIAGAIGRGIITYLQPTLPKSTAVAFGHPKQRGE